jgi:cytochrome c553
VRPLLAAISDEQWVGLGLAVAAFIAFVAVLARAGTARRRPRGAPDIPPAMQPGPSDADLEKPRLEKLQGWGLGLIVFMALWIPGVWLLEPSTNQKQESGLLTESVERGYHSVLPFSEENQLGVGCVRCHGEEPMLGGGVNLFNARRIQVPRLNDVCGGPNTGHGISNSVDLYDVISQGRPDTDMPSWSVRFAGALDDQQIQDVVQFIIALNSAQPREAGGPAVLELANGEVIENPNPVPVEQNVCINPEAQGYQEPVVPAE